MDIDSLRDSISRITLRGVCMPIAGTFFWIAVAILGETLPLKTAMFFAFCATGLVFPLGLAIAKLTGADLMSRSHPLSSLGLVMNLVQLAYWPVVVVVHFNAPEWTAFTMAVLFGSHFLPYAWLYRSQGYALIGGLSMVLPVTLAFAGLAQITPVALVMVLAYVIGVAKVLSENRRDGYGHAAGTAATA